MSHELLLAEDFGPRLADGAAALAYRLRQIDPYVEMCDRLVLNFTGVRSANSSFVNALVAPLLEQHGQKVLERLVFAGCTPVIRVLVESAVCLGLQKRVGHVDA